MRTAVKTLLLAAAVAVASAPVHAGDDGNCNIVRFADAGWSDIAATTGLVSVVLEGLGYKPTLTIASLPIAVAGIKNKQIDVFLGYWQPMMTPAIAPFVKAGQIEVLARPNLVGAKYTLAVPRNLYNKGLKSFADIARFKKQLNGKIYGIEPGNASNALILDMIKNNDFGLRGFELVQSSEADMLVEAQRAERRKKAIVFLGWEPHPMNVQMQMAYLTGGDDVFGPKLGAAEVYTAVPEGYLEKCPNLATLLANLQFTTDMESQVMGPILDKVRPNEAARAFLEKNPAVVVPWLKGVTTFDGRDGLVAVTADLNK